MVSPVGVERLMVAVQRFWDLSQVVEIMVLDVQTFRSIVLA